MAVGCRSPLRGWLGTRKSLSFVDGTAVDRGTRILLYKKPGEDPQIFYSLELKSYAIKKDTFLILQNLQPFLDDDKFFPKAEAKLEQRGKLSLFSVVIEEYPKTIGVEVYVVPAGPPTSHTSPGQIKQKTTYHIVFNSKNEIVGIKSENFQEVMHELIPDAPLLLDKIDKKILKFKDLEKIITDYNQMFK